MKRSSFLAVLILSFTVMLGGCAVNKADIRGFNIISTEEEKQLGDKFALEIEKTNKVVADKEMQSYVERIGKRLLRGARSVDFDYTFKVVKDDSVNAFAIPGGHTYVHTGLLKMAASEDELAAVMAHEINHVVARHGTRQMTQQYGYGLILQLLLGENPNQLAQMAAQLFGNAGSMAYSREMENQADFLGVETMYKAGFNPEGMATFFTKLDAASKQPSSKIAKFFSSHPNTPDRISNVRGEIAKLPAQKWQPEDPQTLKKIQSRLK